MEALLSAVIGAILGALGAYMVTSLQIRAAKESTDRQVKAAKESTDRQIEVLQNQIELALKAFEADIHREKKEFCFRMFEIWSSDFMRKHRTSVWNYMVQNSNGTAFNFAALEQSHTDLWDNVGAIQHFMCDLNIMLDEDVIDRKLAVRLFKSVMDEWLAYFLDPRSNWGADDTFVAKEIAPLRSNLR